MCAASDRRSSRIRNGPAISRRSGALAISSNTDAGSAAFAQRPSGMFRITQPSDRVFRRVAIVTLCVVLAIVLTLTYGVVFLDMPNHDARSLIELLVSSAVISLGVGGRPHNPGGACT